MKHIIIEGLDRLGKDTLIKGLCDYFHYDNITIRHFSKPPKSVSDPWIFQSNAFMNEGQLVLNLQERDNHTQYYETILVWNRSHLGEYVWGTLYRGLEKDFLKGYIERYEKGFLAHQNTYLINLYADPQFCAQHEDGKSLGIKIEDKKKQLDLFNEVVELSTINHKLKIKVDEANQFRPKEDILKDVINFIKQ